MVNLGNVELNDIDQALLLTALLQVNKNLLSENLLKLMNQLADDKDVLAAIDESLVELN